SHRARHAWARHGDLHGHLHGMHPAGRAAGWMGRRCVRPALVDRGRGGIGLPRGGARDGGPRALPWTTPAHHRRFPAHHDEPARARRRRAASRLSRAGPRTEIIPGNDVPDHPALFREGAFALGAAGFDLPAALPFFPDFAAMSSIASSRVTVLI